MIELEQNGSYLVPKCEIHKCRTKVAISTSKRYPQTIGFFCDRCNDELLERLIQESADLKVADQLLR